MRHVLVLQHVPYEGHGYIADYLQEHSIAFDVVRLWEPYAVPDVSQYSARVLEWHGDALDLPSGASLLATSPLCRNQAFAYRNAYGVLFHLELTPEMVQGLAEVNREWAHESFDLDEAQLGQEARALASLMKAQCYRLLDNFFD